MNLDIMNDMQKEAVTHVNGPLLILAGAGSGKTRVITHRAAYLIEEVGINPYNIMCITFTNKAAKEMRDRIDNIVSFGSESIWVMTFHATCVRILRRNIDRLGFENNFTIYDTDDVKSVLKDICKRQQIDTKKYPEKMFAGAISKAKNDFITPEEYANKTYLEYGNVNMIARVYSEYQLTLKRNNALDFDDLLVKTVELFNACPDVLESCQERFKYIMVDEYQDTNRVQFKLISLLAGKYKNICVVGDDDQSIYSFRGADIRNILEFENIFENTRVIKLEQNYRSTKCILDAANAVIANNFTRKAKTLWTDNEDGDTVTFKQLDSAFSEAEFVAEDIRKRVKNGEFEYSDCAVLYRNNAMSRLVEEKLVLNSIPYKTFGGHNFYSRKEIKDILAYLKTIDNGSDDLAVKRIINIPKRGIGATTVAKVTDFAFANELSFFAALPRAKEIGLQGKTAEKLEAFADVIAVYRNKAEFLKPSELIENILDETGYIDELKAEDSVESQARIENIEELITKAVIYEEENDNPTLNGFLEEVALVAEIDELDESDNYVCLLTMHGSKGLEFPNLYVIGMEDGIFPSFMATASDSPKEVEEERRLCYVAFTRARKHLTLTCARSRMERGETHFHEVSRFMREVPKELLGGARVEPKKSVILDRYEAPVSDNATNVFRNKPFAGGGSYGGTGSRPGGFSKGLAGLSKGSDMKSEALEYGVGDTVSHVKFGTGTVLNIEDGGKDKLVSVDFGEIGVKKMYAAFAKLRKL